MRRDILIDTGPIETRVAILEDGRLTALAVESGAGPAAKGTIWLGRVARVVPGIAGAFIELGLPKAGFLAVRDAQALRGATVSGAAPIAALAREGERLIVQGRKAPQGEKGVKLTADIALPGRFLVHTPRAPGLKFSARIVEAAERSRLGESLGEFGPAGFVVRTQAKDAPAEDIRAEALALIRQWQDIEAEGKSRAAPAVLWAEPPLALRTVRDHLAADIGAIWFTSRAALNEARSFARAAALPGLDRLLLHEAPEPLFEHHGIEAEIERALARAVALPSGGQIAIETTRALTAIDVDSGGYTAGSDLEANALHVDLEAAAEIARQIRLRNLGGIFVIDFIPLREAANRERLLAALAGALKADPTPVRMFGYSALGLVEFTRRRQGAPLVETLTEDCPACAGEARVPKTETIAAALVRRAERESRLNPGRPLTLIAAPEVIATLTAAGGEALLSRSLGARVALRADPALARGRFDLSLG